METLPDNQDSQEVVKAHQKPYDYKLDKQDNDGNNVIRIYAKAKGYVIYRTANTIRIDMDDDHPLLNFYEENHYKIGIQLAKIYSLLPENLSSSESINRLVGRAMALNVAGHCDSAMEVLRHAESRLVKLKTVRGRLQYTVSAFCLALLLFCALFLRSWGESEIFLQVMLCGALGGVLSIAVGYGSLKIDVDAGWHTNCTIGVSRIIIAVIASLFVYFAIKTNLIFSFVNERPDHYGIFTFAMVAGFAEMLVPNIMNNLSKDARVSSDGSAEKAKLEHSQEKPKPTSVGDEQEKPTKTPTLS